MPVHKRLVTYRQRIDALLEGSADGVAWDAVLEEHLVQISFFQHERLIHLLVTLAFALMELAAALVAILTGRIEAVVLMLMFLVLLVPYVVHYYHLENGTQKLYEQYDRLRERVASS
jgi:Ca2+/Na+ antiporter